jgi:hypothetical protein
MKGGENYPANVYRQTTDELMFKSVISTQRWNQKSENSI